MTGILIVYTYKCRGCGWENRHSYRKNYGGECPECGGTDLEVKQVEEEPRKEK